MKKYRTVKTYKSYTVDFLDTLSDKVRIKFIWTFKLIEDIDIVPDTYLKHLDDGIYEVRVKFGSNVYRVLSFFDKEKLILTINGFQKKSQKAPKSEILKAKQIRYEYERNK